MVIFVRSILDGDVRHLMSISVGWQRANSAIMVCVTPPDDSPVVIKRNKFVWLLVGSWLAVGFVPVAQADIAGAEAAFVRGDYDTA